jgi:hypothetical protein
VDISNAQLTKITIDPAAPSKITSAIDADLTKRCLPHTDEMVDAIGRVKFGKDGEMTNKQRHILIAARCRAAQAREHWAIDEVSEPILKVGLLGQGQRARRNGEQGSNNSIDFLAAGLHALRATPTLRTPAHP